MVVVRLAPAPVASRRMKAAPHEPRRGDLPAPGQAVIGIECRTDDTMTQSVLTTVNNQITYDCVMAERAFTLVPLVELAPDLHHPWLGRPVSELLDALWEHEAIRAIEGPGWAADLLTRTED